MKRPDNPLQELAEKLKGQLSDAFNRDGYLRSQADELAQLALPIVGTLLQAERAAATEHLFLALNLCIETFLIQGMHDSTALAIAQNAVSAHRPADASALAAVVQRETAQLRELLRETAEARHMLHGGDWNGDTFERPVFENCASPLCVLARAALK